MTLAAIHQDKPPARARIVIRTVAEVTGILPVRILGRAQQPDLVAARRVIFHILTQQLGYSCSESAAIIRRDRTAYKHLTTRMEDWPVIDRVMTKISNAHPDFFIFEYGSE